MPYSKTELFNLALAEVPAPAVTSDTENSPEAKACRRFYDACLAELVDGFEWRFAKKQAVLAEITNDREDEWTYAYQVPSDCAKPLALVVPLQQQEYPGEPGDAYPADLLNGRAIPYDLQGTTIYTNQDEATLRYVRNSVVLADLPALTAKALYLELAARVSGFLTQRDDRKAALLQLAATALVKAQVADRQKQPTTSERTPDWIKARA